jgi:predicted HicB family RNase H-like nuclease
MKKSAQIAVKMYPEIKQRLEAEAKKQDRSVNWLATKYISDGLIRDGRKPQPPDRE